MEAHHQTFSNYLWEGQILEHEVASSSQMFRGKLKEWFFAESMCCGRGEDDWSSFPLAPKSLADCCLKGAARVLPSQGQDSQSCPCQENFSHHLTAPCPLSTEHSHSHLLVIVHKIVLPPPRDVGVLRQVCQQTMFIEVSEWVSNTFFRS